MSLKYSGTGDEKLRELLVGEIRRVEQIEVLENIFLSNRNAKNLLDIYAKNQILVTLCLALGVAMAGLCDVQSFKLLSEVRNKFRKNKRMVGDYGFNMGFEMAVGFLFLGNGSLTFGNQNF